MSTAVIVPVGDEGLGNSAYLVDLGDGPALAVLSSGPPDRAEATGLALDTGR